MNNIRMFAAIAALAISGGAFANDAHHPPAAASAQAASAKTASAAPLADGEVKKIDAAQGKITVRHGPLPSLEMPPMTMVFRVKDPAMLGKVKPGDKIRFQAEKVNGALTITQIDTGS